MIFFEKRAHCLSRSCCANVCTKFLSLWKPSHLLQLSNIGTNKRIKWLQVHKHENCTTYPSIFYKKALNPCFVYAFVIITSLHFVALNSKVQLCTFFCLCIVLVCVIHVFELFHVVLYVSKLLYVSVGNFLTPSFNNIP
jgi:hypothetical protein